MSDSAYAVILAGGKGERFWPLSVSRTPKQLLTLFGGKSMLAAAVERIEGLFARDRIYVITGADLLGATRAAAPRLLRKNIIGEPCGRDTGAAIAVGAALVKARDPEAAFCVLTADHLITDTALFRQTLAASIRLAKRRNVLITIGIPPATPSTGFGYIEVRRRLKTEDEIAFFEAKRFLEKPDARTAAAYVKSRNCYWNAGMFIWSVKSVAQAFAQYRPPLAALMRRAVRAAATGTLDALLAREYPKLDKISIDYAVMEKARNIVMARGTFGWDDIGSWPALENHFDKDAAGNVLVGECEQLDSRGNIVVSKDRVTALLGVKDLVVIQAEHATLVCSKARAQDVKKLVQMMRDKGRHPEVL